MFIVFLHFSHFPSICSLNLVNPFNNWPESHLHFWRKMSPICVFSLNTCSLLHHPADRLFLLYFWYVTWQRRSFPPCRLLINRMSCFSSSRILTHENSDCIDPFRIVLLFLPPSTHIFSLEISPVLKLWYRLQWSSIYILKE